MPEERILGVSEFNKRILNFIKATEEETRNAVHEEAEAILKEARNRTPVRFGALKASGQVVDETPLGSHDVKVVIGFGGPDAPYAIFVHENLEAKHTTGRAKFLESAVQDAVPGMSARIAERIMRSRNL